MNDIEKSNLPTTTATEQMAKEDSVIIYRSWFDCLLEQGRKRFTMAVIALLLYAFYAKPLEDSNLPKPLLAIVKTFIPVMEANRRNRKNGAKGASFGKCGGRPTKNPGGVIMEDPAGGPPNTPNVNVNENENVNENVKCVSMHDTASGAEAGHPSPAQHTDARLYIDIFFFRNLRHPEKQAEKFVNHYTISNWQLSGGDTINTSEQRRALAKRWEVHDDPAGRFREEDLAMWHKLYDIAPPEIRPMMLDRDVAFFKAKGAKAKIACPKQVVMWLEQHLDLAAPIILPWTGNLGVTYTSYDIKTGP